MNELIVWIMAFMMATVPPAEQSRRDKVRADKAESAVFETPEEANERYRDIAEDLVQVVYNPNNKPLFEGPDGRAHTVAVMLSIMFHESGFRRDVDQGDHSGRGDSGHSWCMMQIMAGKAPAKTRAWNKVYDRPPQWGDPPEEIEEGVTGPDLVNNRQLCFYEGLKIARWSFSRCGGGIYDKLKVYASGSCDKGAAASRRRIFTAERFWTQSKDQRTWSDDDIVSFVQRKRLDDNMIALTRWSNIYALSEPQTLEPLNLGFVGWRRPEPTETLFW